MTKKFEEIFGDTQNTKTYFAPGRINLIGEHTDYNGGHVFPCSLSMGTYAVARKNPYNAIRFYSMNFDEVGLVTVSMDSLKNDDKRLWVKYPKGVIWEMQQKGYQIDSGMDILYYGDIPHGAGLSSSASIEVLTAFILKDLFDLSISMVDIALISQKAENTYVGMNCGIMDQFVIAMGKKEHAVFLDTNNLSYEYVPLKLDGCKVVIMNTNKKRGLADSKYNERRSQCEAGLELLKTVEISALGELSEEEFEKHKMVIQDEIIRKRVKHAVYENQRTMRAVDALKNNDLELLGKLMIDSHNSLRDDYEVTGIELDTLVEAALKQQGCIGARMTGAGFGGCAISIVKEENIDQFIQNIETEYEKIIEYKPSCYVVQTGDGPTVLE